MLRNRLLITQSLLASWNYQYKANDTESAHKDFLKVLHRKKTRTNQAMLDGIQFENMVAEYCAGTMPPEQHKWANGVTEIGEIMKGAQLQVSAYRDSIIDGIPFLLYGRLDGLQAGVIYDIKFSKTYQPGKYLDSPQHPMYFACVPEATQFNYVIYTGKEVCIETYRRQETSPIENIIRDFVNYLKNTQLDRIYLEKWRAKE